MGNEKTEWDIFKEIVSKHGHTKIIQKLQKKQILLNDDVFSRRMNGKTKWKEEHLKEVMEIVGYTNLSVAKLKKITDELYNSKNTNLKKTEEKVIDQIYNLEDKNVELINSLKSNLNESFKQLESKISKNIMEQNTKSIKWNILCSVAVILIAIIIFFTTWFVLEAKQEHLHRQILFMNPLEASNKLRKADFIVEFCHFDTKQKLEILRRIQEQQSLRKENQLYKRMWNNHSTNLFNILVEIIVGGEKFFSNGELLEEFVNTIMSFPDKTEEITNCLIATIKNKRCNETITQALYKLAINNKSIIFEDIEKEINLIKMKETISTDFCKQLTMLSSLLNEASKNLQTRIHILAGPEGGNYIKLGYAIKKILENKGYIVNVSKTAGSIESMDLLDQKSSEYQIAFVQSDVVKDKIKKDGKKKLILSLYEEIVSIVAKDSIKGPRDLINKRIYVGELNSGTYKNAIFVLDQFAKECGKGSYQEAFEIDSKGNINSALKKLKSKEGDVIDALFFTVGWPFKGFKNLKNVRLISISDIETPEYYNKYYMDLLKFKKNYPYFQNQKDINSLAVVAMLITTDEMPDSHATKIVDYIFDNLTKINNEISLTVEKDIMLKEYRFISHHPGVKRSENWGKLNK